jgi:hypothetical protein
VFLKGHRTCGGYTPDSFNLNLDYWSIADVKVYGLLVLSLLNLERLQRGVTTIREAYLFGLLHGLVAFGFNTLAG